MTAEEEARRIRERASDKEAARLLREAQRLADIASAGWVEWDIEPNDIQPADSDGEDDHEWNLEGQPEFNGAFR